MDEAAVLELFESCSNVGRWGADDELGTLNLITAERRLAALRLPRTGHVVSLGLDLEIGSSRQVPPSAAMVPSYRPPGAPLDAVDTLTLDVHGYEATHVDAPGHIFFEGRAAFGYQAHDIVGPAGLRAASVRPLGEHGIVTRGVLLDVAAARAVDYLDPGEGISSSDLEAAEARAGTRVGPGDAVFVRAGHGPHKDRQGRAHDEEAAHAGVTADVLPWLHARDVAVYSGDCIERRPSGYERVPMPLHQVGLVAMGLCILDVPDVEALAAACAEEGRADFLLIVAPLRIPGGTGSPVNPLAIF